MNPHGPCGALLPFTGIGASSSMQRMAGWPQAVQRSGAMPVSRWSRACQVSIASFGAGGRRRKRPDPERTALPPGRP